MMNIIDFVKEFDFIKGRRLRSQGGAAGPQRPPETAYVYIDTYIVR